MWVFGALSELRFNCYCPLIKKAKSLRLFIVLVESVTGYDGRVSGMFVSNLSGSGELL